MARFRALALLSALLLAPCPGGAAALPAHDAAFRACPAGAARPLVRLEAARALLSLSRTGEALLLAREASEEILIGHGFADWLEGRSGVAALLLSAGEPEGLALLGSLEVETVATEDPRVIVAASARLAEIWTAAGRPDRARRLVDGAMRMLSAGGDPNSTASGLCMKAKLLAKIGADEECAGTLRVAESVVPAIREDLQYQLSDRSVQVVEAPYLRANHLLIVADVWKDLGEIDRVRALRATVEAELALIATHDYSDEIHAGLARLDARLGDLPAAFARLDRVGDFALRGETAAQLCGRLLERDGPATAEVWLSANEARFSGAPGRLDSLRAEIALAHARAGDPASALGALARVRDDRAFALALAALPAAHATFANGADGRSARDLDLLLSKRAKNADGPGKGTPPRQTPKRRP